MFVHQLLEPGARFGGKAEGALVRQRLRGYDWRELIVATRIFEQLLNDLSGTKAHTSSDQIKRLH